MMAMMDLFSKLLLFLVVILSMVNLGVESQDVPCTTPQPNLKPGLCVPIHRCRNIYRIITSPKQAPEKTMTYINLAACTLPNIKRSICCQPTQVVEFKTRAFELLPQECGLTANDRISHGIATEVYQYPWMAVLQYDNNGALEDRCGGSLIHKRYVLTAAHCIKTKSAFKLVSVRLGEHTKNQDEDCNIYHDDEQDELDCADPPVDYEIESFVIHPKYNIPKFCNDIGLLRLKNEVVIQDHIKPICLPVTPELRTKQLEKFTVTGWGATENGPGSNVLLQATVPRVDNTRCQQILDQNRQNVQLMDDQICAGGQDKVDACQGDSGGPLGFSVLYNSSVIRFVQFGVVAAGVNTCGAKSVPGIYTRVSSYLDWILDNIEP